MLSVSCTISLSSDQSKRADIEVIQINQQQRTWELFKGSSGGLKLPAKTGFWYYSVQDNSVQLMYPSEGETLALLGTIRDVPDDFLVAVTCGKSLERYGEYVGPPYFESGASYKFWFGCA
jgi:hypothetical protein